MTAEPNSVVEKKFDKIDKKINKRPIDPRYLTTLRILQERFPEAFPASEARILKIGIHKEIKQNTDINGREIFLFLRKYCTSAKYRRAHIEGASRYDLSGITTEVVTAEEAAKKINYLNNLKSTNL